MSLGEDKTYLAGTYKFIPDKLEVWAIDYSL